MTSEMPSSPPNDLESACRHLSDPIEYLRRMLVNLAGRAPESRINLSHAANGTPADYSIYDGAGETPNTATESYNGKTHKELTPSRVADPGHWSNDWSTKREISELLGKLRNFKPRKKDEVKAVESPKAPKRRR